MELLSISLFIGLGAAYLIILAKSKNEPLFTKDYQTLKLSKPITVLLMFSGVPLGIIALDTGKLIHALAITIGTPLTILGIAFLRVFLMGPNNKKAD